MTDDIQPRLDSLPKDYVGIHIRRGDKLLVDYDEQDETATAAELATDTFAYLDYTEELYEDEEEEESQQQSLDRGNSTAASDSFTSARSQSFESIETQDSSDLQATPLRRRQNSNGGRL